MKHDKCIINVRWIFILTAALLLSGCGSWMPLKKPETGPAGKTAEPPPKQPYLSQLWSPPGELYDIETNAGILFEGINKSNWQQANSGLYTMKSIWDQAKTQIGERKGVKEAGEALQSLEQSIKEKNDPDAYKNLNKYMGSISSIAKSYKLSPLSDIVSVNNSIRNVSYFVENNNWLKASAKVRELQGTWEQTKPSMEKIGILGEITKTHSIIVQMKDAVAAEDKEKFNEQLGAINDSMGKIRDYYHGK